MAANERRYDRIEEALYEHRYHALSRITPRFRRGQIVHLGDMEEVLDARDDGRLTDADITSLKAADYIVRARDGKGADAPVAYIVIEVSLTIHDSDIQRALDRSASLRTAGLVSVPWVAGRRIGPGAAALAEKHGVLVDLTGEVAA